MSSVNFLPTISLYKAVEICVTGSSVGRVISTNYSSCCGWSSGINMFIGSKTNSNSWFIENFFVIFDILLSLTGFTKFFSNDWSVCLLQLIFLNIFVLWHWQIPPWNIFMLGNWQLPLCSLSMFFQQVFPCFLWPTLFIRLFIHPRSISKYHTLSGIFDISNVHCLSGFVTLK